MTGRPAPAQRLRDLARLRRVRDRIDREYASPLNVDALARDAHMSAGHLSREFRIAYGESPYSYLMTRRIERAMTLLRRGDLSVTEVCFAVGCASLGTREVTLRTARRCLNAHLFAGRRSHLRAHNCTERHLSLGPHAPESTPADPLDESPRAYCGFGSQAAAQWLATVHAAAERCEHGPAGVRRCSGCPSRT